jgi:16S rRNA (cytosine967-C5)-methyltransferase
VAGLAALQGRLLQSALAMVRPGGIVVYCSCSLQPEEGPAHAQVFLTSGHARRVPVDPAEIGLAEAVTAEGDLRTLPCHLAERGGLDGFYAVRLQKA